MTVVTQDPLVLEVTALIEEEKKRGLVDMKMFVDVTFKTSSRDLLLVYRNVLRMQRLGHKPAYSTHPNGTHLN